MPKAGKYGKFKVPRGGRREHVHYRISADAKKVFQFAAEVTGMKETRFHETAALEKALKVLSEQNHELAPLCEQLLKEALL